MASSLFVYFGLITGVFGLILVARPSQRLRIPTRSRATLVAATGILTAAVFLCLPTTEYRVRRAVTRLDDFAPVWQFGEFHTIRIAAPPDRVFQAIERVRADEIFLFRTLTWLRRGGRPLPSSILDAGEREPLIDVALQGGFVRLAYEPPRELVVGAAVIAPSNTHRTLTPQMFQTTLPPGFALASMNFLVRPDGANGSIVSTETRVYANSPAARRRFAAYWRLIYPGSAFIRKMWLRAVRRRATSPNPRPRHETDRSRSAEYPSPGRTLTS